MGISKFNFYYLGHDTNPKLENKHTYPMSQAIFDQIAVGVADPANAAIVKKINGIFQFNLNDPAAEWVLDLKAGKVAKGKAPKADVTLTMKESDFIALMTGKANGQQMFMSGKIKFKGNMGLVMKLGDLQKLAPQ